MFKDVEYHPLMVTDPSDPLEDVSPPPKPAWPFTFSPPASEAVEYEVQVFSGSSSPFHLPPSPELDEMWHNLYKGGITRITKAEAARLPNKTQAIPDDDGHYARIYSSLTIYYV
ncbi:hypothetical protein C8R43DRAFT_961751 [Mycena crocata]|nr:hypothetical protein C8R43DRAFT_961751 [Mycena crocata]